MKANPYFKWYTLTESKPSTPTFPQPSIMAAMLHQAITQLSARIPTLLHSTPKPRK